VSQPPPPDFDTLLAEALAHHQAGCLNDAVAIYETLLARQPDNAAAWINLGAARRSIGNTDEAVAALRRAVALVPDHPGAQFNLGNALVDSGDTDAACSAFEAAISQAPGMADAYVSWGNVLMAAGRNDDAVAVLERGLEYSTHHPGLLNNLGNALLGAHRVADALPYLEAAVDAAPTDRIAQRNLANALRLSGSLDEALKIFDALISTDPDDADTRCLRAFAHFSQAQFADAWPDYSTRWKSAFHEASRPFRQPRWQGQDLVGKNLLVWGEQAVGDELMFATMMAELLERGGHIIIETEHRLQPLLTRSLPGADIITRTDPPAGRLMSDRVDYQIPIGDLGLHLRPDIASFGSAQPYLRADSKKTAKLRGRYNAESGERPRIGLSWRSGADRAGIARSLDNEALDRLLAIHDCWWLSLQYGDISANISRLETGRLHVDRDVDPLRSLDALAAQIAGLDLVVSVANTTVHVAGALGVPTIALLPHVADWRWMARGSQCHWYPSVRLLRQKQPGNWTSVLDEVEAELAALKSC
jgi:tetratricopeptide (TPR) repeat protein